MSGSSSRTQGCVDRDDLVPQVYRRVPQGARVHPGGAEVLPGVLPCLEELERVLPGHVDLVPGLGTHLQLVDPSSVLLASIPASGSRRATRPPLAGVADTSAGP